MAKKKSPIQEFMDLPDAEKERVVAEFDKEFIADTFRPLTAKQRKLWEKAKRRRGRPKVGAGARKIFISMESSLLKRVDLYAKKKGLSRSRVLAEGAELIIK